MNKIFTTIELFSGTKSFSKVMGKHGHKTFTIDNNPDLSPDWVTDITKIEAKEIVFGPDILWASPPCQGFSVAAIGRNWNKDGTPKSDSARQAIYNVECTIDIIKELIPKYWFIENPRGMLREIIGPLLDKVVGNYWKMETVTYCQYGDTRMKPTDIWTNCFEWTPIKACKNGDKCHVPAPRGSRTGTQGIKGATARGVIPPQLFEEILASLI